MVYHQIITDETHNHKQKRRNQPVQEFVVDNFDLDRKIKEAVSDLKLGSQWAIMAFSDEDKELIADFIADYFSQNGTAMAPNTKKAYIDALRLLSQYVKQKRNAGGGSSGNGGDGIYKPFREMTRDDFLAEQDPKGYLRSLKKTFEQDPKERWVNTYNNRGARYLAFWKWLTQPDLKKEERQMVPVQLKGFRWVSHKSKDNKTRVKREYHWTDEEHKAFLDHCEDLRLKCFHAMHRDTGCRPSELLELKIGDIKFKTAPNGKSYAEFWVGDKINGKMKQVRPVTISDAVPFFNFWKAVHPRRDHPQDAYLFPSHSNKSKYRNRPLSSDSLRLAYVRTIEEQLPKKLADPTISPEQKAALTSLIRDKPHHPYLRRHEFATENIHGIDPVSFNQLMGHSRTSRMRDVYVHAEDSDGIKELQIKRGLISRDETFSPARLELQPKYCPICREANKSDADFCFSCNFILSKKGWLESKQEDATASKEIENTKKDTEEMKQQLVQVKADVDKLIKQAVKEKEIEDTLSLVNPENLEQVIRDFLLVDESKETGEPYYRQDYPELLEVLEKLSTRRQQQQQ